MMESISTKPYLVRAFYEWIVDNGWTPHIIVNTEFPDIQVPLEYVENGQIVLNISMAAVQELELTNDFINFNARFGGLVKHIFIPIEAVMAIYAKENGRGMIFTGDDDGDLPPLSNVDDSSNSREKGNIKNKGKGGRPNLTIVK